MDAHRILSPLSAGALLACALLAAAFPATIQAAEKPPRTVVLVADQWCPVNCSAVKGPPGYAIEIAGAALAAAGWQTEYRVMPWERAIEAVRAGRVDGLVGTVKENTPDFVFPQESIGRNTNVFFTRADSAWRYRGLQSLAQVVLGVANQYKFGEPFDSHVSRFRNDPAHITVLYSKDPVPQGLKMIAAGRIDTYLDDRMVVNWALRRDGQPAAVREAGTLSEIPLYIAFSPARRDARATAEAFDRGVRQLREDGTLAAVLARYGLRDWVRAGVYPDEKLPAGSSP